MNRTSFLARLTAALAALGLASSCVLLGGFARAPSSSLVDLLARAPDRVARGVARFVGEDWSALSTETLRTYATPWKLVTTALLLYTNDEGAPLSREGVNTLLQRYGFFVPERVRNWPASLPPQRFDRPLGIVSGLVDEGGLTVEIANNGCATCHSARLPDAHGAPTGDAWLFAPSTSLDLDAYARDVFRAYRGLVADEPARVLAAVRRVYPEVTSGELATIEYGLLPVIRERVEQLGSAQSFVSYRVGEPGLTNGVASIKLLTGILGADEGKNEVAFTSIPDLSYRQLRTSLLYDGVYAPAGRPRFASRTAHDVDEASLDAVGAIPAIFTVGTLGLHPSRGPVNVPGTRDVMRALATYRSPPFPGEVDGARAERGRALYATRCAGCHGDYQGERAPLELARFPNRLVPVDAIGTDRARADAVDARVIDAVRASADDGNALRSLVDVEHTGGYVAPILSGLWLSAPYLHNGSVPTLWHFLHPEARPTHFPVGGHRTDMTRVGIDLVERDGQLAYPAGYRPWSRPRVYDTTQPGHGNGGHVAEVGGLSDDDKDALLEFLKLL